jgi:D-xylonolactonase
MVDFLPQVVCDQQDKCGEGPLWDWRKQSLVWIDVENATVHSLKPPLASISILSRDVPVVGVGLNTDGGYLISGGDGLYALNAAGAEPLIRNFNGKKLILNDLLVDPHGRVYVGSYYWAEDMIEPGALFLIDEHLHMSVVADDIMLANGLGLSPDHRTLYFADSAARIIYAFDVDPKDGSLSNRRPFVKVPSEEGLPDGLTVDADGYVWNAHWYGSEVVRYDPDGVLERRIRFPSSQISSVAFGGSDLTDLYVTSAGQSWPSRYMPAGYDPHGNNVGGPLYRVSLDVAGRPEFVANVRK